MESVLVANRGEIARRVIRTLRRMGIRAIAVYSEADASLPYVGEADEAVPIGPGPAASSYLDVGGVLEAARRTRAAAIHPGYGFLAESAEFATRVINAGLTWVGPPPSAIEQMGDKIYARNLMERAGVPGALQRLVAVGPVRAQLGQQRIVVRRHLVSRGVPRIDSYAGPIRLRPLGDHARAGQ